MRILLPLLWGVGLAYGFAIASLLYLLKQAFGEPLYEAFLEWWESRLPPDAIETKMGQPQSMIRGETFVISDLHIDTWHKVPPIEAKTRERHFHEFLTTIKPSALELYINGDLVDMPPHPKEEWTSPDGIRLRQSLLPKYAPVFVDLIEFNAGTEPTMTMYMAGNHDMAGSGVRYLLHHLYDLLPGVRLPFQTVWYGHFIISLPYTADPPKAPIRYFLEHGHYHDPVLILYLLQFVLAVVASNLQAAMDSVTVAGQRRTSPTAVPPPPGVVMGIKPGERESFGHRIVKRRWRWKARRRIAYMNALAIKASHEPLDGILMGHTHSPDF